ncbi:type II and III secretion system protein family protein [Tepidicaulis sp. LMO-SS28]|uniref:type II and III secretion system protein family protein n=1 Tax=Tepidicaulis sp. LMO-SS28 TaxID=3447455 RepID=UPI003EE13F8E
MAYPRFLRKITGNFALLAVAAVFALAPASHVTAASTPDAELVKIDPGGEGPQTRRIVLPLHKAAIVELPVAARDVLVSNPAVVDAVVRTPKRTYLIGMETGQTNAFFFDQKGNQIVNIEISVERDVDALQATIAKYLPDARIKVEAINSHIVLSGFVSNTAQSSQARELAARFAGEEENVLNMLTIESKEQVMLKVTVAEMQRTVLKQLGIDINNGSLGLGDASLAWATENSLSLQGQALGGLSSTLESAGSLFDDRPYEIAVGLKAMERAGLARTLAEPTLTAISGESAKFLAGGEFPVPTSRDRDGNVTLEFKPFGVGLGFTPVVMSEGRISMKISTEVSELSNEGAYISRGGTSVDDDGNVIEVQGVTIPALRVRRAETTVELPSGGSLVMAGLISETTRQNIDGVPGVKDVPVLGALFRSRDFQNSETELVVIVTPYLVDSTSRDKLSLPTDGYAPASDMETILMGRLNATYGVEGRKDARPGKLEGPVGFVLE